MPDAAHAAGGGPLAGLRVLVTRPAHQSAELERLIAAQGGKPVAFPAVEILPPRDPRAAREAVRALERFDLAVFVSANAVAAGLALAAEHGGFPASLRLAAVGEASARALEAAGLQPVVRPRGDFGAEGLLALPELAREAIEGRRVLILKGEGGRRLLAEALAERGARVEQAEVYRRGRPAAGAAALERRTRAEGVDVVVATSGEILDNLFAMLGDSVPWLERATYVVVSKRLAAHVRRLGVRHPAILAERASDEDIVAAIAEWRAHGAPAAMTTNGKEENP